MENQEGISLTELLHLLVKNIFLIVGIILFVTTLGIIYTKFIVTPKYQSTSDILVQVSNEGSNNPNDVDLTSTLRLIQTVSEFIEKDIVLKDAITSLNLKMTPDEVRQNLDVSYSTQSLFVTLKYTSTSKTLAKNMVDAIINSAINIADLKYPIIDDTMSPVGVASSASYVSPNVMLNIIISFFLGGVLGVVLALVFETLKTTIRNKKELESFLPQYQVIGEIPTIKDAN